MYEQKPGVETAHTNTRQGRDGYIVRAYRALTSVCAYTLD